MHKGAPDLSKSSATILIDANSHTEVEILDMSYSDYTDIDIVPSKGIFSEMLSLRMCY